ncbi:Retinal guanylyl cyclase 2 [Oryzias melastigma]|uniref:Guanylate cyclase n=1 Tax=Oryzias melastigma TaxID=30732 RepID=A0A834CPU0_ORYME|nr:Retinal guanylyl cyclase 2 [Oryzias melastigma]
MLQRGAGLPTKSPSHTPFALTSVLSPWPKHALSRLLLLALLSLLPCSAQAAWFRVGVVGPWGCDPIFARALPSAAAQLAVTHINRDPSLSSAGAFDFAVLQEPCETSRALETFVGFHTKASGYIGPVNPGYCDAASMLSKGWNKAVFPWACVGYELDDVRSHPTFARSLPRPTWVLHNLLSYFRWAHVAIISSYEDIWVETAIKVADSLRSHGMSVRLVSFMENTPHGSQADFVQAVILCMHSVLIGGSAQKLLLETAYDMKMTDGSLVFVPYDTLLYSLPHQNVTYPALKSNSKLLRAYDAVLTVTIDSPDGSFYETYREAMERGEVPRTLKPQQVSPMFGTIYNSVLLMAHAMKGVRDSGEWISGGNLAHKARSLDFQGFSHRIKTSSSGAVQLDYLILDTDGSSLDLLPTYRIDMEIGMVRFLGRDIHFPHGYGPRRDAACWFTSGVICSGGEETIKYLSPGPLKDNMLNSLSYCLRLFDFHRRRINQIRLVRGPNKILLTLTDVTFINPSLSNKKLSLDDSRTSGGRSLSECSQNTPLSSQSPATYENSNVVIYEGDWAWLKRLPDGNFGRINPKTSDVFELSKLQDVSYCFSYFRKLLWTAPEVLRSGQAGVHGTLTADVYSFAIIMQEVVIRGPPFCMLDLSDAEIIEKVRRPPPLCRPVVSPDYAPMECIQLMKQCWTETPDKRPTFEDIFDQFKNINKGKKTNIIDSMLRMLEQYSSNLEELIRERTEELEIEKQKTEKLLTQMLPPSVAEALMVGGTVKPEYFDSVSLYFSDIVGFTTISANSEPIEVVDLLNDLYTLFDAIIGNHDVYKVETIGDAYMVSSGVPVLNDNRHAAEIANMSLDILSAVGTFKMRHMPDVPVRIRIGLHTGVKRTVGVCLGSICCPLEMIQRCVVGPCVAGVVGLTMPRYCLFGDTVTTASRMESSGMPYRIHVHESTVKVLKELNLGYKLELRGRTEVRGKGTEETFWLVGRVGFTKPLPVPPELKSGQMAHGLQMAEIAQYKKRKAEKQQQEQLAKKKN